MFCIGMNETLTYFNTLSEDMKQVMEMKAEAMKTEILDGHNVYDFIDADEA